MEELKGRHEDEIQKMKEGKEELNGKIEEMGKRIREHEEAKEVGNTELFIAELKDAEVKELHMTNYEDGITFLEGQLTRCQHKL